MEYHSVFKGKHSGKAPWQSPAPFICFEQGPAIVRWFSEWRGLLTSLVTRVQTTEPTMKERTGCHGLSSDTSEIRSRQSLPHSKGSEHLKQPLERETYLEVIRLFLMVWQFRKIDCYFCFPCVLGCTMFHFPHLQNDLITYGTLDFLTYVLAYMLSF